MKKRSISIMGHSTSVSLEDEFWEVLKQIAEESKLSVQELITHIDSTRTTNLSSAIRVFILDYICKKLQKEEQ